MSNQQRTLPRQVVDWYRHQLAIVTLLGAVVFSLIALRIGPSEFVVSAALSLFVIFALFFGSLFLGSEFLYDVLAEE